MKLSKRDLATVDLEPLRPHVANPDEFFRADQHYRLLAYLSTVVHGPIVDIGTNTGDSALALSYGARIGTGAHVDSFDVVDLRGGRPHPPNVATNSSLRGCAATGRKLVTVDGSDAWADRFSSLESRDHRIVSVDGDWAKIPSSPIDHWAVVFIDHAPAERRVIDIDQFADRCELMVVHDTEDPGYRYEPLLSKFRYRYDYKRMRPWTTVVSNRREVPRDL